MATGKVANKTIFMLTAGVILIAGGILVASRLTNQKVQKEAAPSPFGENKTAEPIDPIEMKPTEKAITIENYNFSPKTLEVEAGDIVTIMNKDDVVHTLTSSTGLFDSGNIAPLSVVKIQVPETEGVFPYVCTPHPNMKGEFKVKPKKPQAPVQ